MTDAVITGTFWLLLSVSNGYYNGGMAKFNAHFTTREECEKVIKRTPEISSVIFFCVEARGVVSRPELKEE